MKRILVTGGSGFLGSSLVRSLIARGHAVRVLDDNSRGRLRRLESVREKFEFVQADIRDAQSVIEAARGTDAICHLAFINGTELFYEKPELVLEVGVKGMMNVLDACLEHGVPELLVMSSSEVYQTPTVVPTDETAPLWVPDPMNPRYSYGAGKLISELMAINYGRRLIPRVVIVRPHNVIGPDMGYEHVVPQFAMRMKRLIAEQGTSGLLRFPIHGSGDETRAFVWIDDFNDGVVRVFEQGEHLNIYHVGTMEERTIAEVAHEVARCYGVQIEIVPGEAAKGGTRRRCPDIRKAQALGYRPQVSFSEAVARTVAWYREHGDD